MEITKQQITEELVITPEAMQEAIDGIDEQLTGEKAFDILFGICQETKKDIEEHKAKINSKEPIPLATLCWIVRQSFIMGFAHGLDLYNEVVKGFIADYFGGGYIIPLFLYRLLKGKITALRGFKIYV